MQELQESKNGWQNEGIMNHYQISKKMPANYVGVYMHIVRMSFGYKKTTTDAYPMTWWSEKTGLTTNTFKRHVDWLSENEFINIIKHKGYIENGGSKPNRYAPAYPDNGHIVLDEISKKNKMSYEQRYQSLPDSLRKLISEEIENENKITKGAGIKADLAWWFKKDVATGADRVLLHEDLDKYAEKYPDREEDITEEKIRRGIIKRPKSTGW